MVRQGELLSVFALRALASWVMGANMRFKFPVAPQLKVPHHFTERCAGGWARRVEDPGAFGATPTSKTLLFNPYQLPIHGPLFRCVTALSGRMPSRRLQSKDAAFSFRVAYCLTAEENRHPVRARQKHKGTDCKYAKWDGLSGRLHIDGRFSLLRRARVSGTRSKRRNRFAVGSGLVHLEAISIAQYQGRILRSLYKSSRGFHHALRGYPVLCSLTGEFIPATGGF
jgi:hypothetical protein